MRKYIYITILAAAALISVSCEKEITIDYRSKDPIYVIEGRVTNETTEVIITQTRDMENGVKGTGLDAAQTVTVTAGDGTSEVLRFDSTEGYYRSTSGTTGRVGETYTLTVGIDGEEYVSHSTMHALGAIERVYFRWLKAMGERILFCTLSFHDVPGEDNYYCYRILRNGEPYYQWEVVNDLGNDGIVNYIDIFCMTEQEAKDNKKENWKHILYEGDEIEIELQTIDKRTYDYLFSLLVGEGSANPIDNFTGGCLGYFSAYSVDKRNLVFSYDDVEEQ